MGGLHPDFVLLNPNAGIAIFEVKDWNLDAMAYRVEKREGKSPLLLGQRNGKSFSLQNENPIEKIYQYKQQVFKLYCPRLAKQFGFAAITAGVIFPFADDEQVKKLFQDSMAYRGMLNYPDYSPVSGRYALARGDLNAVFPEGRRMRSLYMKPEIADDLRFWLREPDFSESQRQPLELDTSQRALVTSRTQSGYRRIKGSAGSGKSLVLAARAAELVMQDKDVLVITFNITLLHYLMDIAVRWGKTAGKTRSRATWLNFHAWCRWVCIAADKEEEYRELWKGKSDEEIKDVLKSGLASLVSSILDDDNELKRYDAVLVDEGQDFQLSWWDTLRKVCKPGGEMLLVADATQDIYETASAWTDEAMTGAGFAGPWSSLDVSYRMPKQALDYARQFAVRFLPQENINIPTNNQVSLDLEPTQLRWVHTVPEIASKICVDEIIRFSKMEQLEGLNFAETTFYVRKRNLVWRLY